MKKSSKIKNSLPAVELTRRVLNNGHISARGLILLVVYYLKFILVMPLSILQMVFYAGRIKKTVIHQPPVFIIGNYRSGTSYLHKLLAADKRFGFVSYYDMICPNSSLLLGRNFKNLLQFIIHKLKFKTPFFNNTIPCLDEPAEEERMLINKGSSYADYWKFIFPINPNAWHTGSKNSSLNLFQLENHADHHLHPHKSYQQLCATDGSPEHPAGYSFMVLLSLVPPLWFKVMNKKIQLNF